MRSINLEFGYTLIHEWKVGQNLQEKKNLREIG
jgi:hypothetical protein